MRKPCLSKLPGALCALLLSLLLLASSLAGCGVQAGGTNEASPYSPFEIAQVVWAAQPQAVALAALTPSDDDFLFYLESSYGIDSSTVADGAICYVTGFEAAELAILLLNDAAAAQQAASALEGYIASRVKAFAGYAPEQAALAQQGQVITHGRYVALLICDTASAQEAFLSCFGAQPPALPQASPFVALPSPLASGNQSGSAVQSSVPHPSSDEYDPQAILASWHGTGSPELSEKNQAILDLCSEAIEEVIRDNMSDYEKELAIHDWILDQTEYDWAVNSPSPAAIPEPDNDNPYGALVKGLAICRGYATSFQLFMDMLEIECITVDGAANYDKEEHAWNLVRLNGDWYAVDVTWDDPYGESFYDEVGQHRYFNVTSQFLRETLHYWNADGVPECTATAHQWQE